jgi:colanic acid/amylovoran biosynthesis protein
MRILILNTYSILNRGDAAIVLGQIWLLRKYCPEAHITITSQTPALDQMFYAQLGVKVLAPLTPTLSHRNGSRRQLIENACSSAAWNDRRRLLDVMQNCDLVLACGGGYLYSYRSTIPGTTFWQSIVQAHVAVSLNKPLVLLPQSFGPLTSKLARKGVQYLLERENVLKIFARENVSASMLLSLLKRPYANKVSLCPDMAFYLAEVVDRFGSGCKLPNASQPILGVNVREWDFPEFGDRRIQLLKRENYLNALTLAASFFIQHYRGMVVIVPQAHGLHQNENDRAICLELYERARKFTRDDHKIQLFEFRAGSVMSLCEMLSRVSIWIGTRLHSCILALLVAVPVISIQYQYKSQGIMDMLGLAHFNVHINTASHEHLIALIEEIMRDRQEIQEKGRHCVRQFRLWIDQEVGTLLKTLMM